jgi:hypothetical protein
VRPAARFSVTGADVEHLDALVVRMRASAPRGAEIERQHAFRAVLVRGFAALGAELTAREANPGPFDAGLDPAEVPPPSSTKRPRRPQ